MYLNEVFVISRIIRAKVHVPARYMEVLTAINFN